MAQKLFENPISAGHLVNALLTLSEQTQICLLDSCGVNYLESRYLFAGISPLQTFEVSGQTPESALEFLDETLSQPEFFCIFTLSYEFGLKLENIAPKSANNDFVHEPDIFLAVFDTLVIYDYVDNKAFLIGNENNFNEIESQIVACQKSVSKRDAPISKSKVFSNFTKAEYLKNIEKIKDFIRRGKTYQTNLTQQFRARLAPGLSPQIIFDRLRKNHPAPFSAFIRRQNSTVISASPERFFKVRKSVITTSPVKGTRRRGATEAEDLKLRQELLSSEKDRAENIMIVDLLRNDLGRICEYGRVSVEKLCEPETYPTYFHLVSTINGKLRKAVKFSEIIKAVFPCGSITGAPKISTMKIIEQIETAPRGLSMGAIGVSIPDSKFMIQNSQTLNSKYLDLSVAIRTMTISGDEAVFNVGGGIVTDSDGEQEYEETLTKAKALFDAVNADF